MNGDNLNEQKEVLTSKKGIEYLPPKVLRKKPETISKAILYRYKRTNGEIETVLAIKRNKLIDGIIELGEESKKSITLDHQELKNLIDYLTENIEPFKTGLKKYLTLDISTSDLSKEQLLSLLHSLKAEDLTYISENLKTTPQLVQLANSIRLQKYKDTIKEFEERLRKDYSETSGENSWQGWLTKNFWLFGSNYKNPIPKAKINIQGSMPDFIFPSIDGCVDGIDIKKPNVGEILIKDTSHVNSYYWSPEINKAIGQVVNYLYDMDENRLKLAELLKVNIARPRGIIVAGRSNNWTAEQLKAYRKLSFSLHGVEILTYDHILERAKSLINLLIENEK